MRIGLVAPPWYPVPPPAYGGIELVVALLAEEWHRAGHDVTLVASSESGLPCRSISTMAEPPDPGSIGNALVDAAHSLRACEVLEDFDVIHDHSGAVFVATAARDRLLPPVAHTLHGPWTADSRHFYGLVDHDVHLVAISAAQRHANPHVRYAGMVHNGIDVDAYPMSDEARGDHLVFIGRANPEKNPVGAIRIARAAGRELKMVVKRHEAEELEYWERAIVPLLGHDIEVTEEIDHSSKVSLLQGAYAMVFPITWPEPFGLVMIEALACGTPVLARPCGAAPELVEHAVTGFLYSEDDQLAAAVERVDELDRDQCRLRVESWFSARRMADQYLDLFAHLMNRSALAGTADMSLR